MANLIYNALDEMGALQEDMADIGRYVIEAPRLEKKDQRRGKRRIEDDNDKVGATNAGGALSLSASGHWLQRLIGI